MEWTEEDKKKLHFLFDYVSRRFTMRATGTVKIANFLVECVKNGPRTFKGGPEYYPDLEDKREVVVFTNKIMHLYTEAVLENQVPTSYISDKKYGFRAATREAKLVYEEHGMSMLFLSYK